MGRAERILIKEQVCLDCALDFFFHKRDPGDSPTRHRGYTLATPSEMIVYMYVHMLLAALGEVLTSQDLGKRASTILDKYRQKYSRHRTFQQYLRKASGV